MKVLLINNGKGWSGGQEHLKDLAMELRSNGVEVHFLVRGDTINETRFKALGFPVYLMPYRYGWNWLKPLAALAAILRRERFDIVSINREHDLVSTVVAYRMAFPFKKVGRLMMGYHTATERKQLLLGAVDGVGCISEHVRKKLLRGNPGAAGKTSILYYGIVLPSPPGPSKFLPDRPGRFFTDRTFPLIGMVGEFWKNQGEAVEILALLKPEFPSLKLAFVGNDSDQRLIAPLMEKIRRLRLEEDVIFTGLVPRDSIADVFFDLDLSITTHRNEGFGIVHLESLAAGTPVVAYNEGGFVDIFKGEEVGVLVDGGPPEFAAAVAALLRDNEKRHAMGREGYELMERKYSIRAMGQTYLGFYRKLAGEA